MKKPFWSGTMHKAVRFLLATPLVLLLTSCWDVVPGDVIFHPDPTDPDSSTVTGSFTLKNATTLTNGTSTGGGCLIFLPDRAAASNTCSTDDDCAILSSEYPRRVFKPGYCAGISNADDVVEKHCWYKPTPESCFRSGPESLPLDEPVQLPAVSAYPPQEKRPIHWRVVTCQSMVSGGCASGIPANRLYRYGKIETVN